MESRHRFSAFFFLVGVLVLLDASGCPTIIPRTQWGARAPISTTAMKTTATYVIIHHTVTPTCTKLLDCYTILKSIQNGHMDNEKYSDIGYNFLVSSNGSVYEGRGWDREGAHAPTYNNKSIGISFIGNFQVSNGKLTPTYKLLGHRQTKATDCPGQKLFNAIQTWPNWAKTP